MTAQTTTELRQAELDAALLLLSRMGITPADLLAGATPRRTAPTFAEYIPVVSAAVTDASRRAYGPYWNKVNEKWAGRRIDEPTPSEIKQLGEHVRVTAVVRRNGRGGNSAVENLITALRCLYRHAVADGWIEARNNPAAKVDKPKRSKSTRRAVADDRIAEINHVASTTGNDPALDTLILRLHIETACRRGGALALCPVDLDPDQCLVLLREKGDTHRWQPVSPTLMAHLLAHGKERGAPAEGPLLLPGWHADHLPPLRPSLAPPRRASALGGRSADQYPLAPPHDIDVGRTQLRVRHRPGLRRAR